MRPKGRGEARGRKRRVLGLTLSPKCRPSTLNYSTQKRYERHVVALYAGGLIIAANYADFDVMKFRGGGGWRRNALRSSCNLVTANRAGGAARHIIMSVFLRRRCRDGKKRNSIRCCFGIAPSFKVTRLLASLVVDTREKAAFPCCQRRLFAISFVKISFGIIEASRQ